jgi:hypothetical protein
MRRVRRILCRSVRPLSRSFWVVAGLAALSLAIPAPAHAGCGTAQHAGAHKRHKRFRAPLAIGDSVMLGAIRPLAATGFEVDTRGCRQMGEGLEVLRRRRHSHTLPHLVVIALGANWIITRHEIHQALAILGKRRVLALVTPRELGGGSGSDARIVRSEGKRHRGRIKLLDWVSYSAGHGSWFAGDGLHLSSSGARGFTRLLKRAMPLADPHPKKKRPPKKPAPPPPPSPPPAPPPGTPPPA